MTSDNEPTPEEILKDPQQLERVNTFAVRLTPPLDGLAGEPFVIQMMAVGGFVMNWPEILKFSMCYGISCAKSAHADSTFLFRFVPAPGLDGGRQRTTSWSPLRRQTHSASPRVRPNVQSIPPPGLETPATCRPSRCSRTECHGTRLKPRPSSIMAYFPLPRLVAPTSVPT